MKITINELQNKSYLFLFNGPGMTGTVRVGMIGDCAFSIDDMSCSVYAKRNIKSDDELREFLCVDDLVENDGIEELDALKFDDLSRFDIEEEID